MHSSFVELNLYIYHSIHGALLDVVIWSLGPFVDERRTYGTGRIVLATMTRAICRRILRVPPPA